MDLNIYSNLCYSHGWFIIFTHLVMHLKTSIIFYLKCSLQLLSSFLNVNYKVPEYKYKYPRVLSQLHSGPERLISTSAGRSCRKLPGDSRTSFRFGRLSSPRTAPQHHTEGGGTTTHDFYSKTHVLGLIQVIQLLLVHTVGTWPNFFSHAGSRLACSFSRTSWRAPSCQEIKVQNENDETSSCPRDADRRNRRTIWEEIILNASVRRCF